MSIPALLDGKRSRLLARLVANGAAQAGVATATALLVQYGFDRFITGESDTTGFALAAVGTGILLVALAAAWLRMTERTDAERLGQDYTCQLRITLFDRLSTLAPRTLQKRSRGGVMLRFVGDLTALRQWVSLGLARLTVAGVTTVLALAALMAVNLTLGLTVGSVLAAGAIVSLLMGKHMQHAVREARRRRSYLAANVSEKIASMAVVQAFNQMGRERRRIGRQSKRLKNAMIDRARITGRLRAVTEGTAALATGSALMLGALEVAAGRATAGTVVAAMSIVALLVPPLRDLGRVYEYWHGARVSEEKIRQFLDMPTLVEEHPEARRLREGEGRIEFKRVRLPGTTGRFTATAEPGQVVAIVGPNGSGKSTLLQLAARFIDPEKGRVVLDGQRVAGRRLSSLRRAVGYVSPDLPLLRGSIDKNLRYRCPDASAEELERVRRLCGIDEMLEELPGGAETNLSEGGLNLSLGQRQRIALARALVGNPRILLLDEADANLDPRSAEILDQVLESFDGTVLMVTHRVDRVARADAVWHLTDGELVEEGSPAQILSAEGATARLFRAPLSLAA